MKTFSIIILLLFAFMACGAFPQRGGPRPSGSGQGSARSNLPFGNQQNCQTLNGVTTCTYGNKEKETSLGTTVWILGAGLTFFLYANKVANEKAKKRQAIIDQMMKQFSTKHQEQSAKVPSKQKSKLIDQFMNKRYKMIVNVKGQKQKLFCKVKVEEVKKQNQDNQNKYIVKMSSTDQIGPSHLQGVLTFKSKKLCLKLSKVYENRRRAGQIGLYEILLFQGEGRPQRLAGNWAFHTHQHSEIYSGDWTMKQIDD